MLIESQKARECDGALVCVTIRDGTVQVGRTSYDRSRPRWLFDLDGLSRMAICPRTNEPGQILG
jgi:hypothetical protein